MYSLGVRREFIARHKLVGGDWGPENYPNSHRYVLELQLESRELDVHGYLVDIVEVEKQVAAIIDHFKEQMLNDLPEFDGLNPSLENFARIVAVWLDGRLRASTIHSLRVVLWENEAAWASYSIARSTD